MKRRDAIKLLAAAPIVGPSVLAGTESIMTDDYYRSMLMLLETSEDLGELHRLWQHAKTFQAGCTEHQWKMLAGTCKITYDLLWPLPVDHWAYRPTPPLPTEHAPKENLRQEKLF